MVLIPFVAPRCSHLSRSLHLSRSRYSRYSGSGFTTPPTYTRKESEQHVGEMSLVSEADRYADAEEHDSGVALVAAAPAEPVAAPAPAATTAVDVVGHGEQHETLNPEDEEEEEEEDRDPVRRHLKQMALFSAIDNDHDAAAVVADDDDDEAAAPPPRDGRIRTTEGHDNDKEERDDDAAVYDDDDDDDEDGDLYDVEERLVSGGTGGIESARAAFVGHSLPQFEHRINLGKLDDSCSRLKSSAVSSLREQERKELQATRTQDRSNRATSELVLDPRTRMMLFKMLNRRVFDTINGCVSTGKEVR